MPECMTPGHSRKKIALLAGIVRDRQGAVW